MKYFIYQGNDHDCGFASLKMYLAIISKNKSYLFMPKPSKREKYTLNDLSEIASKYDVNLESYGCTDEYISEIKSPCLTAIDENHIVVIVKRTKKAFIIYDPARGKVRIKFDEFARRWRKIILEASEPKNVCKIGRVRMHILPIKLKLFETICAIISSSILIGTFYLLNDKENVYLSLVILILFVISQIVENFVLYKQVYNFDSKYIPLYFENKRNQTKEKYKEFIDFKRNYFTSNRTFLSSLLIAVMIVFLLCLNDFRNMFVIFTLILLKMLELIVFSKSDNEVKNKIANYENDCMNEGESFPDLIFKANKLADSQIFVNSVKSIFYVFLSFAFAIAMMFVTGNYGCNYVIFHFVMYYAGSTACNRAISGLTNRQDNKKLIQRFLDSCNL